MKSILIFILGLAICLFVGCAVGSIFNRRKGEQYYFWRTYKLYQNGDIDLFTLIMAGFLNIIIGGFVILIIYIVKS